MLMISYDILAEKKFKNTYIYSSSFELGDTCQLALGVGL
jgi:hypothetical protein